MLIFGWTIPLNFVHVCLCCLFWNNNPYAGQFQGIFHHLMIWCNVSPSTSGNVAAQDETMSLSAVEMSSALEGEETANHPSPFVNISATVCDHSYLAACFGSLVDNALVYISGFVIRQTSCAVMCAMLAWWQRLYLHHLIRATTCLHWKTMEDSWFHLKVQGRWSDQLSGLFASRHHWGKLSESPWSIGLSKLRLVQRMCFFLRSTFRNTVWNWNHNILLLCH